MIQKNKNLCKAVRMGFLFLVCNVWFTTQSLNAQVKVHINSGNPVYPFPQFLPYKNHASTLENLATRNGVGVTHAEMEQTIRDAYQIMMNRCVEPGGGVGGKKYIKYRSNPQCSEGDGYGLLGAASMSDKETFDGLWLYIHDFTMNKVKRYSDCKETSPGYAYSHLPGWTGSGANSAADGDVDIGLALLCAYLQWGEFMGINDACGEPISYKKEAIEFLKGLTDTLIYAANGLNYVCGDIGLDGYIKGGDSWTELTDWASDKTRSGLPRTPEHKGPSQQHIDYAAPSYFHAFADFLSHEDSAKYAWNIKQFRRAEASSDWLMGQMLTNEKMIPSAGWVELSKDNVPTYTNFSDGEDFRLAWRTILNAMWYGNPQSSWDPQSHQIKIGTSNSYEQDIGKRYARFLWDSRQAPWNKPCIQNVGGDKSVLFWGPEILKYYYTPEGEALVPFALNWIPGTGSPSAVVSQDFNLISELFRSLEIKWDSENEERYINSIPHYFHGWFRLFGLLTLSGNYQAPSEIKPTANTKVYLAVDKSFAFEGDSVTYTIDYRNYGSIDAKDIVIVDTMHKDFVYISSTGSGVYNGANNTVTWKVSNLPGFKSSTGIDVTKGQVKLTVKVGNASQTQYRNRVSISCSNGTGWTSNEYPNNITPIMERNYLDIAKRALVIKKSASNSLVNPEKDIQFTIDFENTSEAGWINGGRPGVHFAYSYEPIASGTSPTNKMRVRLFHDANEAYIDYGNYRISYFLFDAGLSCYKNANGCPNGWDLTKQIFEGVSADSVMVLHENITPGQDSHGKWNQRIILQFSDVTDPNRSVKLTTTNYHLDWYRGVPGMIHRGGLDPLRLVWDIHTTTYTPVVWNDDWSWDPDAADPKDDGRYWPVTNDWTDPDKPNIAVDRWNQKECGTASHTVDNVLVEEWDGYTWRRVAGNGPLPGRDVANVIIRDTIPAGFTFNKFTGDAPFGVSAKVSNNVISWSIPKLQVKQKGSLKYILTAAGSCPMQKKSIMTRAWISADKESAIYDSVAVTITCDSVPPPPPPSTTMYKTSDKTIYSLGDIVTYKIAYKQTHGTIVSNASSAEEWVVKSGSGKLSIKNDTIVYDKKNTIMVHKYAYGINGTFGGTLGTSGNDTSSIVARVNGTAFTEIRIKREWGDMWAEIYDAGTLKGARQQFTYKTFPSAFDFKVRLSEDTISFWAGDTSSPLPNITQTGIAVRAGYAGVKSNNYIEQTKLWRWNSHLDAAFDLSIHDKLPSNLTYISAGGSIITGSLKGKEITATFNNGDITWPVVNGEETLDANDTLSLWIKATLDKCTGDTIYNTAYTNIRGYPTDYIGARAKIKCSVGDEGKPDHIDIILDTVNFNRSKDEYIDPILIGLNQKTFTIFAVVRDKYGNFVRFANNAVWSSSDSKIATVTSSKKWIGVITNNGKGTTMINVNESGIKGDSISITIATSTALPTIKSAVMLDKNGDVTPDMLSIVLSSDLEEGQKIDSVNIDYRGNLYSIPAASVVKQELTLSVPFTSLTGTDGRPAGNVTIFMAVDGAGKQNTKQFTDGVGPALSAAGVMESNGTNQDVLILTFTEQVLPATLKGKQLLLVKANAADTISLSIDSVANLQNDSLITVKVTSSSVRPEAGDALRLVPGSKKGTISDLNTNLPHDLNPSVVLTLKKGPAQINSAAYFDNNADGYIDCVKVRFKRAVDKNEISKININWNIQPNKNESVNVDSIEKIDDTTYSIPASGIIVAPNAILTNPGMAISISYANINDPPVSFQISDSAAPVIISAQLLLGTLIPNSSSRQADTLEVVFSEKTKESFGSSPFIFAHKNGNGEYTLNLTYIGSRGTTYIFKADNNSNITFSKGDSIWIDPSARISDADGVVQGNSQNRHALLDIVLPPTVWRAVIGPNPFTPNITMTPADFPGDISNGKYGIGIKVVPTTSVDIDNVQMTCFIYDALGNLIIEKQLKMHNNSFYCVWDGYNRNNRIVGTGTYLVSINDNRGKKIVPVLKIAVKR